MITKFVGILPLTFHHGFVRREGMYTTLLMSTGLTFGTISALFGLTNKIIDQTQYTILPGYRSHRQRGGTDLDRSDLVSARVQTDRRARGAGRSRGR
jgi:hypothetical protein